MPAKEYVCIHYEPIIGLDEMIEKFKEYCANTNENDFVECLAYSKDRFVLMKGKLTDEMEKSKVRFASGF